MKLKTTGFTLIELLVVITMMGILSAMAVPDFRGYQERENLRSAVATIQTGLADVYAQARSQSQHQLVRVFENGLEFCALPAGERERCAPIEPLPNRITLTASKEDWIYLAPLGDTDLTSSVDLEITHNNGVSRTLRLHHLSGLIEEL